MDLRFGRCGRGLCGNVAIAETREWLVTNGIGGFACGTVANLLTRRYHGLLIAALKPPLGCTLLLAKLDESVEYLGADYALATNRWASGVVDPQGHRYLESFHLEGTVPVWQYACADALLEKRVWMERGENTTYIRYHLARATGSMQLAIQAFVNYRDRHGNTSGQGWAMQVSPMHRGIGVTAFPDATTFYVSTDRGNVSIVNDWYYGFELRRERDRGLPDLEDHLCAAVITTILEAGEEFTIVASTQPPSQQNGQGNGQAALQARQQRDADLLDRWQQAQPHLASHAPGWVRHLVLAADSFVVRRALPDLPEGKSIIAGYPWFDDWGRDAAIALPGLTLVTGRADIAREILRAYARYLDGGMLPNTFPVPGEPPSYNTADATLWYVEALHACVLATGDRELLAEMLPVLREIVDCHVRGTRYGIGVDPDDGLLHVGEAGVQVTWMDAKIGDWVVTPRIGKPVEINALWVNALRVTAIAARATGGGSGEYDRLAERATQSFARFWYEEGGYCYDVLDGPQGHDPALRPNQLLVASLPTPMTAAGLNLFDRGRLQSVVDACGRSLLTSYGLRSLAPSHPDYRGTYGGSPLQRDSAYHQGTVWGWWMGAFIQAHLRVYGDPAIARSLLEPLADATCESCIGTLGEIWEGDPPFTPQGCFAQAWTVAEALRAWHLVTAAVNCDRPDGGVLHPLVEPDTLRSDSPSVE